ncbi:MAG: hypothetical protein NVSMB9_22490 [Isosphaeraceae bacterium]
MRRTGTILGFAVALSLLAVGTLVRAEEEDEKVPLNQVPAVVTKKLQAKYPGAQVQSAAKGDVDGTKVYEFELKVGQKKLEVAIAPDGKFVGSEEVITEAALPAPVQKAFHAKYPGAKVEEFEKAINGEGTDEKVTYEVAMKTDKGKTVAQFDATGKFLSAEDAGTKEADEKEAKEAK